MRFVHVAACAAVALAPGLLGCSSGENQAPPPRVGVTSAQPQPQLQPQPQPQPPSVQQRAREALLAARLEIQDLQQMSKATRDLDEHDVIARQMAAVRMRRDALLAELAASNGRPNDPRVRASVDDLERAMRAAAATRPQAPQTPPLERQPSAPGGYEAYPPSR